MFRDTFIEFLSIGILALAITFVLFGILKSYADTKTKRVGGTIKYGGALLGYVIVFGVLSSGYGKFVAAGERSTIRLAGDYTLTLHRTDGEVRKGSATIRQMRGTTYLDISGKVESETTPPHVTFASTGARLNGRELAFIYKNSRGEMGIGIGVIPEDRPASFTLNYYDVRGTDTNLDPEGRLVFQRAR
jgi:hypothetical protein